MIREPLPHDSAALHVSGEARYVDDLAYAEISSTLEIPEGTLRAQIHRGLALLRTALEREVTGAAIGAAPDRPQGRPALRLKEVAP